MRCRGAMAALLLSVLLTLPACAHATPTDPTWIAGLYDDSDYDDVILFIIGAVTAVDSQVADPNGLVTVSLGHIAPNRPRFVSARSVRSLSTRAPPYLFS